MATRYGEITERLGEFIAQQQVFVIATAARDGRINVSPDGYPTGLAERTEV